MRYHQNRGACALICSSNSITLRAIWLSDYLIGSSASKIRGEPAGGERDGNTLLLTTRQLCRIVLFARSKPTCCKAAFMRSFGAQPGQNR